MPILPRMTGSFNDKAMGYQNSAINARSGMRQSREEEEKTAGGALQAGMGGAVAGGALASTVGGAEAGSAGGYWGMAGGAVVGFLSYALS